MLAYLMDCISPGHRWKQRLFALIERHGIEARQMGFPTDYRGRSFYEGLTMAQTHVFGEPATPDAQSVRADREHVRTAEWARARARRGVQR